METSNRIKSILSQIFFSGFFIALLIGCFIFYDEALFEFNMELKKYGWPWLLFIAIISAVFTTFMLPIVDLFILMIFENIKIKSLNKIVKILSALIGIAFIIIETKYYFGYFSELILRQWFSGLLILYWIGCLTWHTTIFVWEKY